MRFPNDLITRVLIFIFQNSRLYAVKNYCPKLEETFRKEKISKRTFEKYSTSFLFQNYFFRDLFSRCFQGLDIICSVTDVNEKKTYLFRSVFTGLKKTQSSGCST